MESKATSTESTALIDQQDYQTTIIRECQSKATPTISQLSFADRASLCDQPSPLCLYLDSWQVLSKKVWACQASDSAM